MSTAKQQIVEAATDLFITDGYEGASVREICDKADVTINMISYYFGGKEGLYQTILNSLSEDAFLGPLKVLRNEPKNKDEFVQTLEIFIEQTLDGLLANRKVYILARREKVVTPAMQQYQQGVVAFFEQARTNCLIRDNVDPEMITGLLVGRLADQVEDAQWIKKAYGTNILDAAYRKRWIDANVDVFLYGTLA